MQSETLAQEFARLVKEYHEGDDHTKPEAWNLLADYAVDNADAISAALSDKQAGEPMAPSAVDDLTLPVVGTLYVSRGCATARAVRGVENGPDEYSNLVRISDVAAALEPFRSRLSREGEDSAKVERLRDALEKISDGYGPNHLSAFCRNIAAEALAATRSASATTASGDQA